MYTHLYELLTDRAARLPNAVALGSQDGLLWKSQTGRALVERVDALADELAALGVAEGDRVVLWLPSAWRSPAYLFALWKLGAIAVPFDREMNPDAAEKIIASVEPRLVLAGYGEQPVWKPGGDVRVEEWWEPGSRQGRSPAHAPAAPRGSWSRPAEELAAIFFTSGTTGSPKGCMITHANLCSQVEALRDNIPLDSRCRLASVLPLSHLFELTCGLLYPLACGAAIHYVPSRRGPDIVRVLREQRITHMIAVPQLLTLMGAALQQQLQSKLPTVVLRALDALAPRVPMWGRRALYWPVHRKIGGHLRLMASGGAALPVATQRLWEQLGVRVVQGYGTSECSPVVAAGAPDGSTPIGYVGKPIRGVQVRLSPEGELLVKGPNVMLGYWRDPAKTAEALRDGDPHWDGTWYATGDLAELDPAGNVRLNGRAKDLIVLPSGMKVWPQDVEDVLRAHPAVKDACVMAVPAASGGATLHAYLLPASQADRRDADVTAIVAGANGVMAQHQRLASAAWWPEEDFPRTSTLKVRRHLLPLPGAHKTSAAPGAPAAGQPGALPVAAVQIDASAAADDPVAQAIAGTAHLPAVRDTQTLAELGLDSLSLTELALALEEKTGRSIGDGDLRLDMTVAQVRDFCAGKLDGDTGDGRPAHLPESTSTEQPLWPYTWGRALRWVGAPFDLLYRLSATRTIVLGRERLVDLPAHVIFAGTHHSFADVPLVRHGIRKTPARRFFNRLVIAAYAGGFASAGWYAKYSQIAFGIYPLRQYGGRDASLRGLAKLAGLGNAVLIFPQGEHTRPELERAGDARARFKPGVGVLAQALDAAVVPFGLAGTERMMPPFLEDYHGPTIANIPVSIKRGPLAIAFGAPLRIAPDETPHAFATRLQEASFALTREAEAALNGRRAK